MPDISEELYAELQAQGRVPGINNVETEPPPIDPVANPMDLMNGPIVPPVQDSAPPVSPEVPPEVTPPPTQDPTPPIPPVPSPDPNLYTQRAYDLAQREQALQDEQIRSHLESWGRQQIETLSGQGVADNLAQMIVERSKADKMAIINERRQGDQLAAENDEKLRLATQLAAQHEMPINDLIQYRDPQSMTLAAQQFSTSRKETTALRAEFEAFKKTITDSKAPPNQNFNPPSGGQNPTLKNQLEAYGLGDAPASPELDKWLANIGL